MILILSSVKFLSAMDVKHSTGGSKDEKMSSAPTPAFGGLGALGAPGVAGSIGDGKGSLITPPALEYMLLHKNGLNGAPSAPNSKSASGGGFEAGAPINELESVGYCSRWGCTIAVGDLQGQTAPEPDWYHPIDFVCTHCLQPASGIPIGNPVSADKSAANGKTTWGLRGRFGSVGCALRYAADNRYSFSQETSGLLPLMLYRVYGYKGDVTEIPAAPARTALPPFQPALAEKWAKGEIQFDGLDFHKQMNKNVVLYLPDPEKHHLVSDHCAVMVDAQLHRDKLGFKAATLQRMIPNLYSRPHNPHHAFKST